MNYEAFVLSDKIKTHEIRFYLYPDFWKNFDIDKYELINPSWKEVKFLNENGDDVSDDVKSLPENKGGIYMFIIKCPNIPGVTEYLAYIGRAQLSNQHSLKIRCRKYLYEWYGEDGRPKITRMIGKWGKHLYIKYAEIQENVDTVELEANLINSILPPFNDKIPEKNIKQAIDAFE